MSTTTKSILIVLTILITDQILKIWIKTSMILGQEIHVSGNWFILHFTENDGMAFGINFPGNSGKIILSLFRIAAIAGIAFFLRHLIVNKAHQGFIFSVALILAGAVGNIIDSAFYGLFFDNSWGHVAKMFPEEGGYAPFLYGKVVDMLYFPIIRGYWPQWFPVWGGREFIFFRPVFNIADSSITVGVFIILFFQKRFFKSIEEKTGKAVPVNQPGASETEQKIK
jgi:signal peptidase II